MAATDVVRDLFDAINERRLDDLRRYMADALALSTAIRALADCVLFMRS